MLEFSRTEQRKARKDHKCDVCGKPILKGREYVFVSQKYDGEINTFHQHIHCDAVAAAYTEEYGGIEQVEDVADWLVCEVCESCPERATCGAGKYDTFACEIVHKNVLPATLLAAARESVRRNDDG